MANDSSEHASGEQPVAKVISIGHCMGCDRMARLDDKVCHACLTRPRGGRKWAEISNRCRNDPAFKQMIYDRLATVRAREAFIAMYGEPPCTTDTFF